MASGPKTGAAFLGLRRELRALAPYARGVCDRLRLRLNGTTSDYFPTCQSYSIGNGRSPMRAAAHSEVTTPLAARASPASSSDL